MANELQERYGELLLDHIRADRYPSVKHMNMLEQIARRGCWSSSAIGREDGGALFRPMSAAAGCPCGTAARGRRRELLGEL